MEVNNRAGNFLDAVVGSLPAAPDAEVAAAPAVDAAPAVGRPAVDANGVREVHLAEPEPFEVGQVDVGAADALLAKQQWKGTDRASRVRNAAKSSVERQDAKMEIKRMKRDRAGMALGKKHSKLDAQLMRTNGMIFSKTMRGSMQRTILGKRQSDLNTAMSDPKHRDLATVLADISSQSKAIAATDGEISALEAQAGGIQNQIDGVNKAEVELNDPLH